MPSGTWAPLTQAEPRRVQGHAPAAGTTAVDRWLIKAFLRAVGNPKIRVVLWDGWSTTGSNTEPLDTVKIHDRRTLLRFLFDPELQFGEAYADGRLTVEGDLVRLLRTVFEASPPAPPRAMHRPCGK